MERLNNKLIKLSEGNVKLMNFEEVLKQYEKFLFKEINKYSGYWQFKGQFDELQQIATIGLWRAYDTYKFDVDRQILFMTYAYHCVSNEILMQIRKSKKYKNSISLDATVYTDKDNKDLVMEEILFDNIDIVNAIAYKEILNKLIKGLNERELDEVKCFLKNIKQSDLAKKYNITQSGMSRHVRKTMNRIRRFLAEEIGE